MQRYPATVLAIRGPLDRDDLAGLCERACRVLGTCTEELVACDVGDIAEVDAVTVDALARLEMAARRYDKRIGIRRASDELRGLVVLMGLGEVLEVLGVEALGEPEHREEPGGIEEERDPGDGAP